MFTQRKTISAKPLRSYVLSHNFREKNIEQESIISGIDSIGRVNQELQSPIILSEAKIERTGTFVPNVALSPIIGLTTHHFGTITSNYNTELASFQKRFSTMDRTTGTRRTGVERAWKYEYAEVKMGGKGTGKYSAQQRQELLDTEYVRGVEGHHINNVADHPELQADPNNIKMVATGEAHLKEHNGDFRNKTSGPLIDRDGRLVRTNKTRVLHNELSGIGLAAAIGLGTGFAIGFVINLAQNGMNPDSIKYAFTSGIKTGGENAILAVGSTILGRSIGTVASTALTDIILTHIGGNIAEQMMGNIAQMCTMGTTGSLTIIALSIYQFAKLKQMGYSTKESLLRTGKSAVLSVSILTIAIVSQGLWGGPSGMVVSIVAGIIFTGSTISKTIHDRNISRKIALYTITLCQPVYE